MKKPPGEQKQRWKPKQAFRRVIANHYPNPVPSMATIAKEMGCSKRSAQNARLWCEEDGSVRVEVDAGMSRGKRQRTNRYHLTGLEDDCMGATSDSMLHPNPPSEVVLRTTPQSGPLPTVGGPHFVRSAASAAAEPQESEGRQVGHVEPEPEPETWELPEALASANATGRKQKRVFQRNPGWTDATALVRYFATEWKFFIEKNPEWASYRPFDSREEAGRYIKTTFLAPDPDASAKANRGRNEWGVKYSVEQVREMMDQFFLDLGSYRNRIKVGQSAWKRFTATWQPPGGVSQHPAPEENWWDKEYEVSEEVENWWD